MPRPLGAGAIVSPMSRRLISSGSSFERDIGYSRAVVVERQVFVSGTTGFDYATMTISPDVAVQAAQCLNMLRQLAAPGVSDRLPEIECCTGRRRVPDRVTRNR